MFKSLFYKQQNLEYYYVNIGGVIMISQNNYDRITFSLPHNMNLAMNNLKKEIKSSKSEIINLALKNFLAQELARKIQAAVDIMADEYENDKNLTEMTLLDGDDFYMKKGAVWHVNLDQIGHC
jgi:hypothetical protein